MKTPEELVAYIDALKLEIKEAERQLEKSTNCNLCGLPCLLNGEDKHSNTGGLINSYVSGGFDSTAGNGYGALDDGTTYCFSLCEFCLDWLFSCCIIPPVIYSCFYNEDPPEVFKPAAQRIEDDQKLGFRKMGDVFFKEKERRDAARKTKILK